jgi:hypothetical protein
MGEKSLIFSPLSTPEELCRAVSEEFGGRPVEDVQLDFVRPEHASARPDFAQRPVAAAAVSDTDPRHFRVFMDRRQIPGSGFRESLRDMDTIAADTDESDFRTPESISMPDDRVLAPHPTERTSGVARVVVLDEGPLWLDSKSKDRVPAAELCRLWMTLLANAGAVVVIPEIADYEVRRELIRAGSWANLRRLDAIKADRRYLYAPITTQAMLVTAKLWAEARQHGVPTASPESLDADAILAAQATIVAGAYDRITIATGNIGHLARFRIDARPWEDITWEDVTP